MKRILSTLTLLLCFAFTAVNAQDNYDATTMGNIVRYYETAKWAQGSPFNNQCWTNATQQTHAKTGCVPTAFAIIMRHHGFPAEGIDNLLNQQTGEQFTDRTYDYNKMPLTNGSGWTTEQQNEVAKLMAHLGHAFGVTFGQGTTSVSIGNTMSERMQKFFNYNYAPVSNQYAGSGQMYDFEEWKKNLKNSLDNGCPVPYAADNKKDGTNDTRHMFVIDGYTENEYFHFNFGWGGGSNGWYKLDDITPTGDDYSWRTTSDGYDSKHQAFFNLMPNTATYTVTATVNDPNMGTVSINNGTAGSTATADLMQGVTATLTAHPAQGYALASWTKNGVVVGSRNTIQVTVGTDANDYVANFDHEANVLVEKDCKFTITDVTTSGINGNYCSTWTTNDGIVLSCTKGSEAAYALSTTVNTFFAKAAVVSNSETLVTDITYTLTAPAGYIIKSYSFKGKSPSSSYTIDVTVGGNTTNITNASAGVVISASDINAQSTSFVLSSTYAGRAGLAIMDGVTVTIQSEGGGSTPTPDPDPEPEPDPTPTTCAVTTTANPAAGGTAKFAVGTGSQQTQGDVENGASITLYATANTGYNFVNWTLDGKVVSTDATCNVDVAEAQTANYFANFEQIVVNATLTDAQSNTYKVQLSGFTNGVKKETVADKLHEAYPYITLGTTDQEGNVIDFGVLNIDGTAYTYTNRVELPFKVSNATYIWHNIYYPANSNDNPNYIAALNEDEVVDMAASKDYAYGDNPTYNTKDGGNSICWAIYNVNNSFEFIFKSRVTNKYIKVESVSSSTTENVKFVENAEDATAFTLLKDAGSYNGDYALVAKVGNATGYLCATSSDKDYVTHFDRTNHQGAWVKFVEAPDYFSKIMDMGTMLGYRFGAGDRKCVIAGTNIEEVDNAMQNSGSITLNKLNDYAARMEAAMATENPTWFDVKTSAENGAAYITLENDDPELTSKRVPGGYELTVKATPAEGYHFVSWTSGTNEVSTVANYTFNITAATALTANFAKNSYNVSVTAGEGGSATASATAVEHGGEVTLTADENDGYDFAGWYNGEEFVSAEATYTVTNVTSDINYTARFEEVSTGTVAIHITVASTDGTTVTNAVGGNVKAIISNIGQEWATGADFVVGADVELVASSDYDQKAYLFDGWYKNDVLVSEKLAITVKATEAATYEARFFRGCVVIGESNNNRFGYISSITLADGTSIGYDAADRAVVKPGTEVKINTFINMYGYEVGSWTKGTDVVSTDKDFIVEVNEDVTYTANFEPASYNLTVRANDDERGTVSAESGTSTGTNIKVGHNMEATITATAKIGYRFVNWTKGTDVVSTKATYTIDGIADVEDMVDVEYIANFVEADALGAGYYRIAYDFPVAAAAKSAATRAAGDVVTYSITPANGTPKPAYGDISQWTFTKDGYPAELTLKATSGSTLVKSIWIEEDYLDLATGGYPQTGGNSINNVTYTLSVQNSNYRIVGYEIECKTNSTVTFTPNSEKLTSSYKVYGEEFEPVTEKTFSFESDKVTKLTVKSFNVYIQEVGGGETPETVRYYMQSVACGVSGGNNLQNALKMTQETGAASIFYYAGNKLLSYDKGTYIKEDGGTRGLQAVGAYGDANIKVVGTNDEDENICTVAAPNYMHANSNGTTYYVDHCGSNPDNHAANHNFVLEEVTSLPVTITDAGYATWYAPVAVQLPDGLTAYTITIHGDYAITGEGFKQVPANTGVILEGTKGTIYELEIIGSAPEVKSIMEGTVAATYFPENDYAYVLSTDKGTRELGFYMADDGEASWSHKAYLPASEVPAGAALSAGFRLILPGTTAVENVEMRNEKEEIYDLTGRKLEGISGTGIYIINGKKVLIK